MSEVVLYAVRGSKLVPLPTSDEKDDIHAVLADAPLGIYTALRSFPGRRFLRLGAHLERCRQGIALAGWPGRFDFDELARAIGSAADAYQGGDFRLRLDLLQQPTQIEGVAAQVLLALAPHHPVPSSILRDGAKVELAPRGLSRPRPRIKLTDWVRARRACEASGVEAYEYLLLDQDQRILEGTSSNFYAVCGESIMTAPDGILEGITRKIVLELAVERGLNVRLSRPSLAELEVCDETFISSSTRGIVPVSSVAGKRIGTGKPGPVFEGLFAAYRDYAEAHAAPATP